MPSFAATAQARTTVVHPADPSLGAALRLGAAFALLKLALHIAATLWSQHLGYSYFRDEFYYIMCGRHLAWGYVDHGPLVAIQARLAETLFGTSLLGIRLLSHLAGAAVVFLTGILAWALGGRRSAQTLALLGVLVTPQYLGTDGYLSMNSVEPIFWMTCLLCLILIQRLTLPPPSSRPKSERSGDAAERSLYFSAETNRVPQLSPLKRGLLDHQNSSVRNLWLTFGISAGLGLLNKHSMTFFLAALGIGLLLTPQRRILFNRWTAVAIALLTLIALPNLFWQIHHGWPTLEFLQNGRLQHKNIELPFLPFLRAQIDQMHPLNTLLWITGIVSLLRGRSTRHMRWIALTYLVFFAIMFQLHAKDYYLAPIYPVLFAAGAIAWQHRFARTERRRDRLFAFPIFETALTLTGILILPMAMPVLKPDTWVAYTTTLHLRSGNTEHQKTSALPQFYADRFGWQQYLDLFSRAYNSLSPEDQTHVTLWADNYGEAGAIDVLGTRRHLGLPPVISGHNTYWLWGPGNRGVDLVIAISGTSANLDEEYTSVTRIGCVDDPLSMPYEHKCVYLLRHRRPDNPLDWKKKKDYI